MWLLALVSVSLSELVSVSFHTPDCRFFKSFFYSVENSVGGIGCSADCINIIHRICTDDLFFQHAPCFFKKLLCVRIFLFQSFDHSILDGHNYFHVSIEALCRSCIFTIQIFFRTVRIFRFLCRRWFFGWFFCR